MQLFRPPKQPDTPVTRPLIYLNGPIQGCPDWQREVIKQIGHLTEVDVASPRVAKFSGKLDDQMRWEITMQEITAKAGVILWWFPRETSHRCNRAYAQAARFELGEWAARSKAGLARIVVGFERGFTGGPYLRRRLTVGYPNIPICSSLRQICAVAVELARTSPADLAYPFLKPPELRMLIPGLRTDD